MECTLLVLAAGMGSRYGGLKQLDPMGPNGETVLDYSVFDALRAGFTKVVFVIRRDFAAAFQDAIGSKFEGRIEVAYAYQELDDLPEGFTQNPARKKPWGTAHAVLAARKEIETAFAVVNADDFYGHDAYARIVQFFKESVGKPELRSCLVAYSLRNTLSAHGTVNRGLCSVKNSHLLSVEEHEEIRQQANGSITGKNLSGAIVPIMENALVSMNFWGFTPAIFGSLEAAFITFLETHGSALKSECYLPTVVDTLIREEQTACAVLETSAHWFGVTYPDDKPVVQAKISALVTAGDYPAMF